MKHLALLSLFTLTLTACGSASVKSQLTASAPDAPKPHALYSFIVDSRPVDGPYQKLNVKLDELGTYTASMQTITPGDLLPVTNTTEEIGANLVCQEEKTANRKLQKLFCTADNRPADGYLIELSVIRNEDKLYDVILHKSAYSMLAGHPGFDETTELSYGMTRQN